jgi:hypothetical protein
MHDRYREVQKAAAHVAILSRWREADDPELINARRQLVVARAEAKIAEAAEAVSLARDELRALDTVPS